MATEMHTYSTIADHGDGEGRSILERRDDGLLFLTTNAETRQPVRPQHYSGPGWDTLDVEQWIDDLAIQFGNRDAAEAFAHAAGF